MIGSRRRNKGITLSQFQDPGKDLFAYLFLVMMVIFLLFMGTQGLKWAKEQESPGESGTSPHPTTDLKKDKIGRLVKQEGKIYLSFKGLLFSPEKENDLYRLEKEGIVYSKGGKEGGGNKVIYLWKQKDNSISLMEYLSAFQLLSDQNIKVLFVEESKS